MANFKITKTKGLGSIQDITKTNFRIVKREHFVQLGVPLKNSKTNSSSGRVWKDRKS